MSTLDDDALPHIGAAVLDVCIEQNGDENGQGIAVVTNPAMSRQNSPMQLDPSARMPRHHYPKRKRAPRCNSPRWHELGP